MINNLDFADRLKNIMDYYHLSAASFADKIKVQRSSISHLLSGRNKPSLDFVLKVLDEFKEVELYWLLNGKGHFPNNDVTTTPTRIKSTSSEAYLTKAASVGIKEIESIIIFYKDGTFSNYAPNENKKS